MQLLIKNNLHLFCQWITNTDNPNTRQLFTIGEAFGFILYLQETEQEEKIKNE